MKTCKYYYGVNKATWHDMPYDEALLEKNRLAFELVLKLQSVKWQRRQNYRISEILRAIKHNETLLRE